MKKSLIFIGLILVLWLIGVGIIQPIVYTVCNIFSEISTKNSFIISFSIIGLVIIIWGQVTVINDLFKTFFKK